MKVSTRVASTVFPLDHASCVIVGALFLTACSAWSTEWTVWPPSPPGEPRAVLLLVPGYNGSGEAMIDSKRHTEHPL
jgi:hypothetical protein